MEKTREKRDAINFLENDPTFATKTVNYQQTFSSNSIGKTHLFRDA